MPTREEYEAAGLLEDCDTADRIALLDWLSSLGITIEDMTTGQRRHNLNALAGDLRMVPGVRLTATQAAERSGLDRDQIEEFSTALGFAPIDGAPAGEVGYTLAEIELFETMTVVASMFSAPEALSILRVIGSSVGRLAEALVSMFLSDVESPHVAAGASESELATKIYEAVGLLDGFAARLDPILRRHVVQAVERSRRATVDDNRLRYRFAVGFVDLVGFTERSSRMSPAELTAFIRDFEGRAHDVATACGARVVKLIGDEVMFVATDADAACRAASALTEAFDDDGSQVLPRGGLAYGDVLTRGGDYYGSVVNLASRLVDEAVPQEVLVTSEVVAAATGCTFQPAGRRMVKGFHDPVPVWSLSSIEPF
jgi:class 3 adenylate cyclase